LYISGCFKEKPLPLNYGKYLFFSTKTIHMLWCLVFCSQLAVVAFSALDYTCTENISITKESEEPKPKDGKAFTDLIEESSFLVTELPVFAFFLYESSLSHFKFLIHTEFVTALDSPPPEYV
jgi:hypothetical protein